MAQKGIFKKIKKATSDREEFEFNNFANLERELLPKDESGNWLIKSEEGQLLLDIYKDGDNIVIIAALAGVRPQDLEISVSHDLLTIRGKRQSGESIDWQNYYYQECYWGAFSRSVVLPFEVRPEGAKATLKNGILKLTLPRAFKAKVQNIKIDKYEE